MYETNQMQKIYLEQYPGSKMVCAAMAAGECHLLQPLWKKAGRVHTLCDPVVPRPDMYTLRTLLYMCIRGHV